VTAVHDSLFITGATGFIGRHLLSRVDAARYTHVYCLSRTPNPVPGLAPDQRNVSWLTGSLEDVDAYARALESCGTVIHLAATTGKAAPEAYFRVNAHGTQLLLDRCAKAGVENFLYVSSIVAKFPDKRRYYYAQSKEAAEAAVRRSGLSYVIARPTIVMGDGNPTWTRFSRAATAPVALILGNGRAAIQPIYVGDLVECLLSLLEKTPFANETLELGGPERMSIRELFRQIHQVRRGRDPWLIHVPLTPVIALLSLLERPLYPVLPVTAGQLASFHQHGTADHNRIVDEHAPRMKRVRDMLRVLGR